MTTSPGADIPQAILSQGFLSTVAMVELFASETFKVIEERLGGGQSLEAVMEELIGSTDKSLKGDLLSSAYYLYLRRYNEAFAVINESWHDIRAVFDNAVKDAPTMSPLMEQLKRDLYKTRVLPGMLQSLEGLRTPSYKDRVGGAEKVVAVLWQAREDGQENAIWEAISDVERGLPLEWQSQMEEFRNLVRLLVIEDPFEGLRALAKSISEAWPKDVDCVDAVREQRR